MPAVVWLWRVDGCHQQCMVWLWHGGYVSNSLKRGYGMGVNVFNSIKLYYGMSVQVRGWTSGGVYTLCILYLLANPGEGCCRQLGSLLCNSVTVTLINSLVCRFDLNFTLDFLIHVRAI